MVDKNAGYSKVTLCAVPLTPPPSLITPGRNRKSSGFNETKYYRQECPFFGLLGDNKKTLEEIFWWHSSHINHQQRRNTVRQEMCVDSDKKMIFRAFISSSKLWQINIKKTPSRQIVIRSTFDSNLFVRSSLFSFFHCEFSIPTNNFLGNGGSLQLKLLLPL